MRGKSHKMIGISFVFLAMVYILVGTSSQALSQETATIVGTVRDAQGNDVEGVKIIVKDSSGKVVARAIPVAPTQHVPKGNKSTLGGASTLVDEQSIGRQDTGLQPSADTVQKGPVVDAQAQQFTKQPVMVHMVENLPVGQYVLTLDSDETSYQGGTVVANLGEEGLTVNWKTTPNRQVIAVAKQGTEPVGVVELENTSTVAPSAAAEGDLENEITASSTEPEEFFGFGDTSPVVSGTTYGVLDDDFGTGIGLFPIVEIEEEVASPSQ
jgi:hypothetical protein